MFQQLNEFIYYRFDEEIFIAYYVPNCTVGIEEAKKIVEDRLRLFNGSSYPGIILGNGSTPVISKEARDYFAKGDGIRGYKALAIVVDNPLFKILGNLFVTFSKPEVETKIFASETEAKTWLKSFLDKK